MSSGHELILAPAIIQLMPRVKKMKLWRRNDNIAAAEMIEDAAKHHEVSFKFTFNEIYRNVFVKNITLFVFYKSQHYLRE